MQLGLQALGYLRDITVGRILPITVWLTLEILHFELYIQYTLYVFIYYENRTKVHNDMKEENKKIHKWNTKINGNH